MGLSPSNFTVELTETQISQNMAQSLENLTKLRIADFGLALDDFGTGHANIDQLSAFPFTVLKIDKRFVMCAEKDRFAETCVEAAVNIARAMNMRVIAEGVEDEWAFDFVRQLGVEEGQGYLFSKALPANELADFVQWTCHNDGQAPA
jgi:EAL domain-containing protein (putative c-di-GMP-specific phosphodiesterase class I)